MHLLDGYARRAFDRLTPLLVDDETERGRLRYLVTTLPARWTLMASLGFVIWGALAVMRNPTYIEVQLIYTSTAATVLEVAVLVVYHFIGGAVIYKVIYQLTAVSRLYRSFARVDLFRPQLLHGLSGITVRAALALLLINYIWIAPAPQLLDSELNVLLLVTIGALCFVLFLWPLWGAHRLLQQEKGQHLGEIMERVEAGIAELHRAVEIHDLTRLDAIDKTLNSLETAQRFIARASTWPWRPETPRLLITAILLPIGLFLVQRLLDRALF